jgi:cell division protein FtsI/penicillin-binding protein 2
MEDVLHGKWGEVVYEVDANNRIVREISYEAPVNGMDVQLSIDLDIQQYAERVLQTQLRLRRQFTVANPEVERFQQDGTVRLEPMDPSPPSAPRSPTRRRPVR